ncbi:MAG TPA: hypothetical protein DCM05_10295 [Elusimicrobia bacterium]|nr:hypothetical protein [Elusimicrobiota bacterium]
MLRVWDDPQTARKFAQTYLEDAIGQGPFLDFIQQSLAQPLFTPPMSKSPMSRALRRDFESHVLPFTAEQSRLIRGDDACYWTFAVLRNDDTPWTVEALSRQLGMSLSDIRRALANLRAQGLIQRTSDGRYRCPRAGRIFSHERVPAGDRPEASPIMQDLQRRWERMRRHHGVTLFHQALFIRASESDVRQYYPYFAQCIAGGQIYNVTEKGPDSALLLFEGRVERLLPF